MAIHTLAEYRANAERTALRQALSRADGDRDTAARILDIDRATLYRLLGQYPEIKEEFPVSPGPVKNK